MFLRRFVSLLSGLAVVLALAVATSAQSVSNHKNEQKNARVVAPINLAILIQDDLISQVDNELNLTRDFIRSLPQGSQVMVGYITTGTLQVRQPFTTDLNKAASSLRILRSSTSASAFNPYVEVIEALRRFDSVSGRKAVLLISDGLDTSRGFDATAAGNTLDLRRAIREADKRDVAVYTFYAPSVGFSSRNRLAASYGQSSLNRLADETGGKAFFQGTTGFVSFDSYFHRLRQMLNDQYARAY
jgi:VWFA-related protein